MVCVLRDKYLETALRSGAGLLVLNGSTPLERDHIRVSDIETAWVKLLRLFSPESSFDGVHPSAVVHPEATLEDDVRIDAGVIIARGARIGRGTVIGAGCIVGENAVIGADCRLLERVTVRHRCVLGSRVLVQSGAVIGADGFGFHRTPEHHHIRQEQIGTVCIEDDVEIGANCVVDRGTLSETVIGARSKLGPSCIIAHNCKIGVDVILIGAVQLAGSVTIKDRAVLWGQVGSIGHLTIGEGAVVTAQSGISKDVPDGATWRGSPAQDIRTQLRLEARFMALETMEKRLKDLERSVLNLEKTTL
ncbi:MAG: UDP-3-O-(3-hydroxymyristoyl)glucosamine N-acyltransferase [Pleurocapsa sp. SU_196_0]|nr:UDP-3-O-(3-hydroxymyristoyl)glucosamine N-acyltransferase [Pleurocapsa sp. SU_196_0]